MYLDDFHFDGLRYDEVTVISGAGGQQFCRDITSTLRYRKPQAIQIAEYWNWDRALPVQQNGLGYDAALSDRLRIAVRAVLAQAAQGGSAELNWDPVRDALRLPDGFRALWRSVVHLENHDLVDADREDPRKIEPRIAALACEPDRRSWFASSRSRVATTILLTSPGIPMLFMGQEFLEDKPWHNSPGRTDLFIYWGGLETDAAMRDFLVFTRELCWLRRRQPALRAEGCNPFLVDNGHRVIAFHRWVPDEGRDVIVVASLNETTLFDYRMPCPVGGAWLELFNSEAYDSRPAGGGDNGHAVGNPWGLTSDGPPLRDLPCSAVLNIPANGALIFARDRGDAVGR
jgi:1,4-alpha-glucan branching enzyme